VDIAIFYAFSAAKIVVLENALALPGLSDCSAQRVLSDQ